MVECCLWLTLFWGWGGGGFFINRNGLGAALLSTVWLRASAWCLARGHPREHSVVKLPEQTHRQTEAHTQTHTHTHRQTEAHRAQSTHRQTDRSTQSTQSTQTDRSTQSTQSTEHTHTHYFLRFLWPSVCAAFGSGKGGCPGRISNYLLPVLLPASMPNCFGNCIAAGLHYLHLCISYL